MPRREGPVHVATTTREYKGKVYKTHLLRRTYREGKKVKHETLGNLSHLPDEVVEVVRACLKGNVPLTGVQDLEIVRTMPHGHVAAVLGTLFLVGLDQVLGSRPSRERDLVVAMIATRILCPSSKLCTARGLKEETFFSSLGEQLGVSDTSEDELYAAMDWLLERQLRIEQKLAKKHLHEGSLVLYDVSSSTYTGRHCELAEFGHNRDGDNGYPQIVYGLLCNAEGCPVAIRVFKGNTGDPTTLGVQITKIREEYQIERVVLVGDRGMITNARIREELRGIEGMDWITALRAPAIAELIGQGCIQLSLFDTQDLAEISSDDYPNERLIVCHNPLLAEERTRKREELLVATEKSLAKIAEATHRANRPLRGRTAIALRVGKVINRFKMAKHFIVEISEDHLSYQRDTEKISKETQLDGLYVIRTSVKQEKMSDEDTVRAYKDLSKVERAFRSMKTVDLKVRPIFHRNPDRVRAHVFICMLAYYVEWHMRKALSPILFDEDDKQSAESMRDSIVAPAQRSPSAQLKACLGRTPDDIPVHSFQSLLKDLATIAINRARLKNSPDSEFSLTTIPTSSQRRALDLLHVSL